MQPAHCLLWRKQLPGVSEIWCSSVKTLHWETLAELTGFICSYNEVKLSRQQMARYLLCKTKVSLKEQQMALYLHCSKRYLQTGGGARSAVSRRSLMRSRVFLFEAAPWAEISAVSFENQPIILLRETAPVHSDFSGMSGTCDINRALSALITSCLLTQMTLADTELCNHYQWE